MMACRIDFYSLLYTTWFTLCSGFVLISSATAPTSELQLFSLGESLVYQWKSTVLLNEIDLYNKNVGFVLDGKVVISTIWVSGDTRLLKFELNNPKLLVKSRKARVPDGYIHHSSNLDTSTNKPFLAQWVNGEINGAYFPKEETQSLKNLKKGITGLFQLSASGKEVIENDPSGICKAIYTTVSPNNIMKRKLTCSSLNPIDTSHPENILRTTTQSQRSADFVLDDSKTFFKSLKAYELHQVTVNAKEDLGGIVVGEQELNHEKTTKTKNVLRSSALEDAINEFRKIENIVLIKESIIIEEESPEDNKKKFIKEVDSVRELLKDVGGAKSVEAFLRLLQVARTSNNEDILKVLNSKKNAKILPELYDILGYTQTKGSHQAVMKKLNLNNEEHQDLIERYLWALSFSSHPNVEILEDLLNKYRKYTNIPDKVKDTLILTLASMAKTLSDSKRHNYEAVKILKNIEETIINNLDYAKDEDRFVFFNALKNLQSPSTIPFLIQYIKNGTLKEETLAWGGLKSFGKPFWTEDILKLATKTLFMLDKKHDTSSRTIAADVILGSEITDVALEELLNFAAGNDTNYEIKQYVFQSIKMLAEKNDVFNEIVQRIRKKNPKLNNYSSLSPRGLSTALTRSMFIGASSNGSLVSIQEIKGGIVKRGAVDVVLDRHDLSKELFTLGIFSGGLTTFMTSGEPDEEDIEETATAGMELTVLGRQIRPFVFFNGQGELVGHVWSGTASDMTPAFQALILWQDYEDRIKLGNGFVAEVNFKGAASFDLSGKISISLWNKNAESLIEKSIGIINRGSIRVPTSFVISTIEFEASTEPKLSLEIDADFSSNVKLCMRLSQPNYILSHYISNVERIPNSKQQFKITRTKTYQSPGITYALNRKNSEMCSALFS